MPLDGSRGLESVIKEELIDGGWFTGHKAGWETVMRVSE